MKLRARGGATCHERRTEFIFARGDDIVHRPSLLLYALNWLLLLLSQCDVISAQIDPAESAS
jgi:hypothetical protein